MPRSNVTSSDVAAAAGVSRATVSYVLNGVDARVSEPTRQRVLEAARELGYTPNAMASALRAGRTEVVIFALPDWPLGPVMAEFVSAMVRELDGLGYTPLVHFADPSGLQRACDRVRPVGLIAPAAELPAPELLRAHGTRGVVTWGPEAVAGVPGLVLDQRLIGAVAVEHLVERGHTRLLAVTPLGEQLRALGELRLAGAREAAQRLGAELVDVPADELTRGLESAPTGVYAFNDELALDVRDALPPGTALVGTDASPFARLARPRLTTITLGAPEDWQRLARLLHSAVEDPEAEAPRIDVRPQLLQGETT